MPLTNALETNAVLNPIRPFAATLAVVATAWLAPVAPAQVDNPALDEARQRLEAARDAHDTAYESLEEMILELEDDFLALTTGPDAPTFRHQLVLAMHDSLGVARNRVDSQRNQGRPVLRGFRRQSLFEAFDGPVRAAAEVDERLASWVAHAVADDLSKRAVIDALTQDDLLRIVNDAFPPGMNWFTFWNEHFRETQSEVDTFIQTYKEFEDAGTDLMREQHPERYGPRGEIAPPGMVVVPGGSYTIGPDKNGWETTDSHRESLRPFFMDRREVTNQEYAIYVNALPMSMRKDALPRGWALDDLGGADFDRELADHPVLYVSWSQANAYARTAGKRLPTEVEWEAAAAGLDGLTYPWGNGFKLGHCNGGSRQQASMPVESFPLGKSASGCFDLAGNAWEWTATTIAGDDIDELPDGLLNVVIRGGSFMSERNELQTRYRWAAPGHDTFSSPRYTRPIGFRCVTDL